MSAPGDEGKAYVPADGEIVAAYSAVTGYDPRRPETDRGAMPLEALKYWRKTGIAGRKIGAYVRINPQRPEQLYYTAYLFGSVFAAFALPEAAQYQEVWDVLPRQRLTGIWAPWSWGGHMVMTPEYDRGARVEMLPCVTWGRVQAATVRFYDAYCDEAYAVLSEDMLRSGGKCPNGFDWEALRKDLVLVGRVGGAGGGR